MLVTSLLCLVQRLLEVEVGRPIVLEEVLLGVLDYAVGAERHQALSIAAEVGQELLRVVGAEDLAQLGRLGEGGHSRHGSYNGNCFNIIKKNNNNSIFICLIR